MNWQQVCEDKNLANLPYKLELNQWGQIVMSPGVEILSPSNPLAERLGTSEKPGKRELYFTAGALEFWLCHEKGRMRFFNPQGEMTVSGLCPDFPQSLSWFA